MCEVTAAGCSAFFAGAVTGEKLAVAVGIWGGRHRLWRRQRTEQDSNSLRAGYLCSCWKLPQERVHWVGMPGWKAMYCRCSRPCTLWEGDGCMAAWYRICCGFAARSMLHYYRVWAYHALRARQASVAVYQSGRGFIAVDLGTVRTLVPHQQRV